MATIEQVLLKLYADHEEQTEFYQAVAEVLETLGPVLEKHDHFEKENVVDRLVEPERQFIFRVAWQDDHGQVQVNKGYRVQFNSALGPYKGGLRFHPSVNLSVIKFLGFEQIFKNSLIGLPIGGGKGGSDFDPKGRSDAEIMRFCQAFMSELYHYIGPNTDVPAGDIGVGAREIGYLYGQYKRLTHRFEGALTGKGIKWGGSLVRTQATGYGCVYFAENMLNAQGEGLEGSTCVVSGAGNVAIYTIEKIYHMRGLPVTASDSRGMIYDPSGIDLDLLKQLKERERRSLIDYLEYHPEAQYTPVEDYPADGHAVWRIPAQAAFPCATQNELTASDAQALVANGVTSVCEGANMPCTAEAVDVFLDAGILYAPGKASNAGGVATSQLEMQQNACKTHWTKKQVNNALHGIMGDIYQRCSDTAKEFGQPKNLVMGANIAGFRRVADAMIEQGVF